MTHFLDTAYLRLGQWTVRHPVRVLILAFLSCAVSLGLVATRLTLKTSNLDLVSPDQPEVKNFLAFAEEFGTPNVLVVVFEGVDEANLREAVNRVAPRLRQHPGIRGVIDLLPFHRDAKTGEERGGYLMTDDHSMYFVLVQPADSHSSAQSIDPFVRGVREALAAADLPALNVRAGLTGIPQYALDDRDVIQHDITRLSLYAFLLVFLLFYLSFHAVRRPLLAMGALQVGVVVTTGVVACYPGHLTLLSACFASILFGLGVDYGIHLVHRVEELMGEGMNEREAIPLALQSLGRTLTTGSLTTALLFFSLLLSGFKGFEELGVIAGLGILICLVSMVTVLPALLVLFKPKARHPGNPEDARMGRFIHRLQSSWVAAFLVLVVLASLWVDRPGFSGDYLALQPRDSESVHWEREMVGRSKLSPQFAVFTVATKDDARALTRTLVDNDTVGEVHSIADFDAMAAFGMPIDLAPKSLFSGLRSERGRYAVYAYPEGDIWDPATQAAFIQSMKALDPRVTGMPFLGHFMIEQSKRALWVSSLAGSLALLICVYLDFRSIRWTLLAVLPTALAIASLPALMRLFGIPFNPLNVMALPVVIGIAEDNGVHIVHRFLQERGDLRRTLVGTGRSVVMTSLTDIAAFGLLGLSAHRGLASFGIILTLGVSAAMVFSVLVLPALLRRTPRPENVDAGFTAGA